MPIWNPPDFFLRKFFTKSKLFDVLLCSIVLKTNWLESELPYRPRNSQLQTKRPPRWRKERERERERDREREKERDDREIKSPLAASQDFFLISTRRQSVGWMTDGIGCFVFLLRSRNLWSLRKEKPRFQFPTFICCSNFSQSEVKIQYSAFFSCLLPLILSSSLICYR